MRARFASTVFGLMNNASAIARLVPPVAASSATRASDEVSRAAARVPVRSASERARAANDRAPIASNASAEASSTSRARFLRRARRCAEADDQGGAGAFEPQHIRAEVGDHGVELADRSFGVVTLCTRHQYAGTGKSETGPRPGQARVTLLEAGQHLRGRVEVACADARLDPVRLDPCRERLDQPGVGHRVGDLGVVPRRCRGVARSQGGEGAQLQTDPAQPRVAELVRFEKQRRTRRTGRVEFAAMRVEHARQPTLGGKSRTDLLGKLEGTADPVLRARIVGGKGLGLDEMLDQLVLERFVTGRRGSLEHGEQSGTREALLVDALPPDRRDRPGQPRRFARFEFQRPIEQLGPGG